MKQFFPIIAVLFISLRCFGTDLLVVDKDTFYLKTYPLEALNLKQCPFGLGKQDEQMINQYPGYQAVWRIVEGKLYLEKIVSVIGKTEQEENLAELFKRNGVQYRTNGKMVLADWFSITYYPIEPYTVAKGSITLLGGSFEETYNADKALVRIEKGLVTINKLPKDNRYQAL